MKYIVSAPCKIHLLGEHAVVYGKPALLATVDLRVKVVIARRHDEAIFHKEIATLRQAQGKLSRNDIAQNLRKVFEPILKTELNLKEIPPYDIKIVSEAPMGSGLGSSAAISAAYFGAMLLFLGKKWNLEKINALAYEAEKVFHGNPSGGDNTAVCYGGLVWFQKGDGDKKIIKPLTFTIPKSLAKNFVLINTGAAKESTKDMVAFVQKQYKENPNVIQSILDSQEKLTSELLKAVETGNEKSFMEIINAGEQNLEKLGVVSEFVTSMIRIITAKGGAAKICGGGGIKGGTGVLLTYHKDPFILKGIARVHKMPFFKAALGVEGLRQEIENH